MVNEPAPGKGLVKIRAHYQDLQQVKRFVRSLTSDFTTHSRFFQAAQNLSKIFSYEDTWDILDHVPASELIDGQKLSLLSALRTKFKEEGIEISSRSPWNPIDKDALLDLLNTPIDKVKAAALKLIIEHCSYYGSGLLIKSHELVDTLLDKATRYDLFKSRLEQIQPDAVMGHLFNCAMASELRFAQYSELISATAKNPGLSKQINRFAAYTARDILVRDGRHGTANRILNDFNVGYSDSVPALHDSPEANIIRKQAQEVVGDCVDFSQGFGALTYDCRRYGAEPVITKAFKAISSDPSVDVVPLHYSDLKRFPGNGFKLCDVDLSKCFNLPIGAAIFEDLPPDIKIQWAAWKDALDQLPNTDFYFLRGALVVSAPYNSQLVLPGAKGENHNYSLIVYNDHFHNNGFDTAYLVPTEVIRTRLDACAKDPANKSPQDLNEMGLDINSLKKMSEALGASVLNIGSAANYYAGLCNAYPPESEPFQGWQQVFRQHGYNWGDADGHRHKWFLLNDRRVHITDRSSKFDSLKSAHDLIYGGSRLLIDQLYLIQMLLARWHKGGIISSSNGELAKPLGQAQDPTDLGMNPHAYRMLDECQRIHNFLSDRTGNLDDYPVLAVTPINWSEQAKVKYWIDTFDMRLYDRSNNQLKSQSLQGLNREALESVFTETFIKDANRPNKDIRLIHRDNLKKGIN
jgi:hypothetical protein